MQCALEAMVDSLRAEVHSVKHQLRSSQETLNAEKMELQRELESTQQKLMMLQAQSEAHKVATHLDAHTLPKFCSSWTIPPTPSQKVPHFIQMPNSETGSFHSLSRIPQGQGQGIIYNHSDNLPYWVVFKCLVVKQHLFHQHEAHASSNIQEAMAQRPCSWDIPTT